MTMETPKRMEIKDEVLKSISSDSTCLQKLGAYLQKLDDDSFVYARPDRERVEKIQRDIECIVKRLTTEVAKKDGIFSGQIENMGSYYDGLKVGAPDEFDFLFILDQFTHKNGLQSVLLTERPRGFAAILVDDEKVRDKWPVTDYCLVHEQLKVVDKVRFHSCNSGRTVKVLDPLKIQARYRTLADQQMPAVMLPDGWCHGGCNRPNFSGHRKHGPATLFQFIYRDEQGEIKVTIDFTLAIRIEMGEDLTLDQMDLLKGFPKENKYIQKLVHHLETDPGMHVIPLYSKLLIEGGFPQKKHNWKVSGSCSEKFIFQSLPNDCLLKKMVRVLKIFRDKHLTYFRRKTERKTKCRRHHKVNKKTSSCREKFATLSVDDVSDPFDTTDLTEVESVSQQPRRAFLPSKASFFQNKDISFYNAIPQPGSGEYWGPRQYIASVEIKTLALTMLFGGLRLTTDDGSLIDYSAPADDATLALLVLTSVDHILGRLLRREQTKYIYFDTALCSPLSEDSTCNAIKGMHTIIKELYDNSGR